MPGRLDNNLRRGHRAEDLGVSALRAVAAVAETRQEDDVGVDAVATLLEPRGRVLRAGANFAVQIKAASVKRLMYEDDEVAWFLDQRIPLFFSRVDLQNRLFELYPSSPGRVAFTGRKVRRITFDFRTPERPAAERVRWRGEGEDDLAVSLGPPIITATPEELLDEGPQRHAYEVLASWLDFEYRSIELSRIGTVRVPGWNTGGEPSQQNVYAYGSSARIAEYMETAEPYLTKLSDYIRFSEASERFEEAVAFLLLAQWFREEGVETDFDFQMDWRARWPRRKRLIGDAKAPPFEKWAREQLESLQGRETDGG